MVSLKQGQDLAMSQVKRQMTDFSVSTLVLIQIPLSLV